MPEEDDARAGARRQALRRLPRILDWTAAVGALGASLWQIGTLARVFVGRITYPMDLEWLEGLVLYQAHRLMHHEPIYLPPGHGFLPQTHPPLHSVLLAGVGRVFGLGYTTGRAVSIAFFCVACAVAWRLLARQLEDRRWSLIFAVVAVGTAAASFPATAGWYDFVRDDSMALGLTMLAAGLAAAPTISWPRVALIAVLLVAAGYTRLTTVFPGVWIGIVMLRRSWRHGLALGAGVVVVAGLILLVLQLATDGWFWTYTVSFLSHHPLEDGAIGRGLGALVDFAPFLVALPPLAGWLAYKRWLRLPAAIGFGLLVASVPAALLPYAKTGGYKNDFIPVVFLAGPVACLLCTDLVNGLRSRPSVAWAVRTSALALFAVFLGARAYDPDAFLPSSTTWHNVAALREIVAKLDGEVISPQHPFLPIDCGKTGPQLHEMPYMDLAWAGVPGVESTMRADLRGIGARWVVVGDRPSGLAASQLVLMYELDRMLPGPINMMGEESVPIAALLHRR
jgi:hypothetical protein